MVTIRDFHPDSDDAACRSLASRAAMSSYGRALERQRAALSNEDAPLDPADRRLVAILEAGGPPVGFVELRGSHVSNLFVDPSAQGGGIGTALLAAAEATVVGDVTLRVFMVNPKARALYERLGYVHVGDKTVVFRGFEERAWCMIKRRPASTT